MLYRNRPQEIRRERGQSLIIAALAMAALMGLVAMTIDIGIIYHERRSEQNAADAAALAGAASLPPFGASGVAQLKALDWAKNNGYDNTNGTTVTVTYPYNSDVTKMEVKISRPVSFIFARVLGLDKATITGRAVAQSTFSVGNAGGYAIFANNSSCSSYFLDIQGSNMTFIGGTHSNGKYNIGSGGNKFTGATNWVCNNGFQNQNGNNTFNPAPAQTTAKTPPINYAYSAFPCTVSFTANTTINSVNSLWFNNDPNTKKLKDNVICSTKTLTLQSDGITGKVTLVSQGKLTVSGSNNILTPNWNNVLFYSSSAASPAMDINGSGGSYTGYFHAPNGQALIQGSGNLVVAGSVIADKVKISGSSFKFDASGLAPQWPGPGATKLIE